MAQEPEQAMRGLLVAISMNPSTEQVFLRGWNAGLDFAIKQMKLTCDEVVAEEQQAAE